MRTFPSVLLGLLALGLAQGACKSGGSAPRVPVAAISTGRLPGKASPASASAQPSLTKVTDLPKGTIATLSPLDGALLVTGLSDFFAVIEGDEVIVRKGLERGLPPDEDTESDPDHGTIHRVVGRWPDAVWLVWRDLDTWSTEANLWYDRIYRLRDDRWQKVRVPELDHLYQALWEQGDGCLVGLLTMPGNHDAAALAKPDVVDCPGKPSPPLAEVDEDSVTFEVAAALGFASGELMRLDHHSSWKEVVGPRLVVSKASPPTRVEIPLPIPAEIERRHEPFLTSGAQLFGNSPSEVYIVGNYVLDAEVRRGAIARPDKPLPLFLLRFDGASFSPIPAPPLQSIWEASLGNDGALAVIGTPVEDDPNRRGPAIWLLPRGGKWQELTMPPISEAGMSYTPQKLVARSATDVWVLGEARNAKHRQQALFHTRPRSASSGAAQARP